MNKNIYHSDGCFNNGDLVVTCKTQQVSYASSSYVHKSYSNWQMFWGSMDSCTASAQCAAPCVSSTTQTQPSECVSSDKT